VAEIRRPAILARNLSVIQGSISPHVAVQFEAGAAREDPNAQVKRQVRTSN
jgi:hypothetical protein